MAIEFACPHCEALVRVAESAVGKLGRCPSCQQRLVVPGVAEAAPAGSASEVEAANLEETAADAIIPPSPFRKLWSGSEEFSEAPASEADPPRATPAEGFPAPLQLGDMPVVPVRVPASRRRRKTIKIQLPKFPRKLRVQTLIFLALGLAVFGGGFWLFRDELYETWFSPRLTGNLTAKVLVEPNVPVGKVPALWLEGSGDEVKNVLSHLERKPLPLRSSLMSVMMRGTATGLEVEISPGPDSRLYAVDLASNPAVVEWMERYKSELDERRTNALQEAAKTFVPEVHAQLQNDELMAPAQLSHFRDELALPALLKGFGFHLGANNGVQVFPCVAQRDHETLYFLMPPGITSFVLQPRRAEDAEVCPAKLQVIVNP